MKVKFFMQKLLKKDFKNVVNWHVSYDSLYKLLKQSLGIVKTHFQHLTKIAFRPVVFAKIHAIYCINIMKQRIQTQEFFDILDTKAWDSQSIE